MKRISPLIPGFWILGMILILCGERLAGADSLWRWGMDGAGLLLALMVFGVRFGEWRRAQGDGRKAVFLALVGYDAALLGLFLYPLTQHSVMDRLNLEEDFAQKWSTVWSVAWILLWWCGSAVAMAAEWSRAGLQDLTNIELHRTRAAATGALSLALALAWVVAANYNANAHDHVWEWSKSSRVRPSDATLELVAGLNEDIECVAFFPPASEVLDRVRPYLDRIGDASEHLSITYLDHALEPGRAKELGARKNGMVFFVRGSDKQRVDLDVDYDKAKRKLREFDRKVQESILKVGRTRQTLYLTAGHGERPDREQDGVPGIANAKSLFRAINVTTRSLGVRDLATRIPSDAGIIAILGPTTAFLPEEVEALRSWYKAGGSLLLALEPGDDLGLAPLLADLGMLLPEGTLLNKRYHLSRGHGPADNALLVTNRFGSHPVVNDLSKVSSQVGLIFDTAAALHETESDSTTQVLVRPMSGSWLDLNDNFEQDRDQEPNENQALAMASTLDDDENDARAVVVGDADVFTDSYVVLSARTMSPNAKLMLDSWLWLSRSDDTEVNIVPGKDDPPIRHTRDQDSRWFFGTVFAVPLLVWALGFVWVRRRTRGGRS